MRIRTRKRNIVVPHDPQVCCRRQAAAAAQRPACVCIRHSPARPQSLDQAAPPPHPRPQSFADALIDIIDDGREGLEEGDRANVTKILDAANKVLGGWIRSIDWPAQLCAAM